MPVDDRGRYAYGIIVYRVIGIIHHSYWSCTAISSRGSVPDDAACVPERAPEATQPDPSGALPNLDIPTLIPLPQHLQCHIWISRIAGSTGEFSNLSMMLTELVWVPHIASRKQNMLPLQSRIRVGGRERINNGPY